MLQGGYFPREIQSEREAVLIAAPSWCPSCIENDLDSTPWVATGGFYRVVTIPAHNDIFAIHTNRLPFDEKRLFRCHEKVSTCTTKQHFTP